MTNRPLIPLAATTCALALIVLACSIGAPPQSQPGESPLWSTSSFATGSLPVRADELPPYRGVPSIVLFGDVARLSNEEVAHVSGLVLTDLDDLGRAGTATALIGPETLAHQDREPVGNVRPSGWHTVRYDDLVDGHYLYNRCHLIGYQLFATTTDFRNLITGTRYLNVEGMLPIENKIRDYVEQTGEDVLYRVTPVFVASELLARGIICEARAVSPASSFTLCRYVFNVQPGIVCDYATGDSRRDASSASTGKMPAEEDDQRHVPATPVERRPVAPDITFVLNTNTMRFHAPDCPTVPDISDQNRLDVTWGRDELIDRGYQPCGRCRP